MNKIKYSIIALAVLTNGLSASWILNGEKTLENHPLGISTRSVENGGNKSAIEAYSNGTGVIIKNNGINNDNQVDNSAFNNLVFKVGKKAEVNGLKLNEQITRDDNGFTPTQTDLDNGLIIQNNTIDSRYYANGVECDDNNEKTFRDEYIDGACIGDTSIYENYSDVLNNITTSFSTDRSREECTLIKALKNTETSWGAFGYVHGDDTDAEIVDVLDAGEGRKFDIGNIEYGFSGHLKAFDVNLANETNCNDSSEKCGLKYVYISDDNNNWKVLNTVYNQDLNKVIMTGKARYLKLVIKPDVDKHARLAVNGKSTWWDLKIVLD